MKKHIKIRATLVPPAFDKVTLTLLEQSHLRDAFGKFDRAFIADNGIRLSSFADTFDASYLYADVLFFPEFSLERDSEITEECGIADYARIKEAVEEYNNHEFPEE